MQAKIESHSFESIEVYKCNYELSRNNSGPVICRDCKQEIGPGLGIHRRSYRRSGYICFVCLSIDFRILTTGIDGKDAGFFIDSLGRLRACSFRSPDLSTAEVVSAVYKAMLDEAYTTVDILLGSEGAHPWKISDAAEAMIGREE
jgi:hypothetical protein